MRSQPLAAPSAFDTGAYTEGPLAATWTGHVKAYAAKHGITYGQAMSLAGPSWQNKGQKGGGKAETIDELHTMLEELTEIINRLKTSNTLAEDASAGFHLADEMKATFDYLSTEED